MDQMVKDLPAMQETQVRPLGQEDFLENGMATHSTILAWKIHGQRSVAGYSPWGRKELDTTEHECICIYIIFIKVVISSKYLLLKEIIFLVQMGGLFCVFT